MSERDAVQELRDRAAELERSAKAIEAARVERASAQPPEPTRTTAPAAAAAGTAAATPAPGQLPPGIMTKDEMAAHAERDLPRSWTEQQQMAEGERYVKSFEYHEGLS